MEKSGPQKPRQERFCGCSAEKCPLRNPWCRVGKSTWSRVWANYSKVKKVRKKEVPIRR